MRKLQLTHFCNTKSGTPDRRHNGCLVKNRVKSEYLDHEKDSKNEKNYFHFDFTYFSILRRFQPATINIVNNQKVTGWFPTLDDD